MKWRWREGVERSANPNILRECGMFLIYIFLHQMRKQCLEFALPNPGEIFKHLTGAYNSNSHTRRPLLSYFCMRKQAGKSLQLQSFNEVRLWKALHYQSSFQWGETLALFDPTDIVAKKLQPLFVKLKKDWNGAGRKRKICVHQLIMQKFSTRGRGVCEERGGVAPLYTVFTRAGWYVSDMTMWNK